MGNDSFCVEDTEQRNNKNDNPNNTIPAMMTGDGLSLDCVPVDELEQMITTLEQLEQMITILEHVEECKQRIWGEKNDEAKRIEAELRQIHARKNVLFESNCPRTSYDKMVYR